MTLFRYFTCPVHINNGQFYENRDLYHIFRKKFYVLQLII